MTSNRSDLTSRLQRRLETERAEIEATAARELKVLGESLRGVAGNALRTIEADTAAVTGRMRGMLLRAWVRPLVIGLSLSLGICGGSWAAMRLLWTAIKWKVETPAASTADIEQARQTLTEIEETTWGWSCGRSTGSGSWCFRSRRTVPFWSVGGRPALKLSSE